MGALYSSQSSESIFLIGKLDGKPHYERQFFYLSQNYLDQSLGEVDNYHKCLEHSNDKEDNHHKCLEQSSDKGDNHHKCLEQSCEKGDYQNKCLELSSIKGDNQHKCIEQSCDKGDNQHKSSDQSREKGNYEDKWLKLSKEKSDDQCQPVDDIDNTHTCLEQTENYLGNEHAQHVNLPIFLPLPRKKKLFFSQTYTQWKSQLDLEFLKNFFTSPKRTIYLVTINDFPDFVESFRICINSKSVSLFQFIEEFLKIFFSGMNVKWMDNISLEKTNWTITERCHKVTKQQQYLVSDFFQPLCNIKPSDGYCIMGMSWTDLYPEEKYNFALGQASKQHSSGVFSFGRFSLSTFDPENPKDIEEITSYILWKLLKACSHEIGHLFGLLHCDFFCCLMNESLSVKEAMDQPLFFCPVCLRKIQHVCQFNIIERYERLQDFILEVNNQFPSEKWTGSLQWLRTCREFLSAVSDG